MSASLQVIRSGIFKYYITETGAKSRYPFLQPQIAFWMNYTSTAKGDKLGLSTILKYRFLCMCNYGMTFSFLCNSFAELIYSNWQNSQYDVSSILYQRCQSSGNFLISGNFAQKVLYSSIGKNKFSGNVHRFQDFLMILTGMTYLLNSTEYMFDDNFSALLVVLPFSWFVTNGYQTRSHFQQSSIPLILLYIRAIYGV